jgi:DNA polymerase-3 subunit delta'
MCESFTHPDLHFIFPIPSSSKPQESVCDYYYCQWRKAMSEYGYNLTISQWKEKLDCGNKQPFIGVNAVEPLPRKLSISAFEKKHKLVLFWSAERLNTEATNKILKLVEEPGKETLFIFIAEKRTDLLQTLVSRCQTISFEGLKEYDSISVEFELMFSELLRNAFQIKKDISYGSKIIEWSKAAARLDRENQKDFFIYSTEIIRQAFLNNIQANSLVTFSPKTKFNFSSFSKFVTHNNIEELTNEFEKAFYHTLRNGNSTMIMTDLALKLTKAIHKH